MEKIDHFLKWLGNTDSVGAAVSATLVSIMLGTAWIMLVIGLLMSGSILASGVLAFGPPGAVLYLIYRLETRE